MREIDPAKASKQALGGAMDVLQNQPNTPYPTLRRPQTTQYSPYYGAKGKGDTSNPYRGRRSGDTRGYGGLMGGDYSRFEQALQTPIRQQHQQAVNQIGDVFGARGLYGSSGNRAHSAALAQQNQATQAALGNATAQRYGMQMQDMVNAQNFDLQDAALWVQDAQNQANYGLANAAMLNDYNRNATSWYDNQVNRGIDFDNQQRLAAWDYANNRQPQRRFENWLGLATGTMPGYAADREADAYNNASMWQGVGGLMGGFLGAPTGGGSSVAGDVIDWIF